MRVLKRISFSALSTILLLFSVISHSAMIQYNFTLEGAQEVGGLGDPDGFGTAVLTVDDIALTIDWSINVSNIDLVTGVHIHNAPFAINGPVVVSFADQLVGAALFDPNLAGLLENPIHFYLNVHTVDFPGGAIRGQLPQPSSARPVIAPATFGLMAIALLGVFVSRRSQC